MANLLFTFLASSAKITNVAAKPFGVLAAFDVSLRKWLSGRASPCQGEGREFESRLPLQQKQTLKVLLFSLAKNRMYDLKKSRKLDSVNRIWMRKIGGIWNGAKVRICAGSFYRDCR